MEIIHEKLGTFYLEIHKSEEGLIILMEKTKINQEVK